MADQHARIIISAEDRASKALQQISQTAGGTVADLLKINGQLSALGAGATLAGLGLMARQAIDFAASLNDLALATGTSVETLSSLRNVAEENGISMDQVGSSLQKLTRNVSEAAGGVKEYAAIFDQLGVKLKDGNGLRDSGKIFADVAKAIADIESPSERVAAAMDAFGKTGATLIPLLLDVAKAGDLVATVTTEQAAAADAFNDSLSQLKAGLRDSGESIARDLLPAFAAIADVGQGAIVSLQLLGRSLAVIANDIVTFGQVAAVGLVAGLTEEGQDKIKDLLDQRARFVEAANEDLENVVLRYESILGRVLNPQVAGQGGTKSYRGGTGGDAKTAVKKTVDEFAQVLGRITAKDAGLDPSFRKDLDTLFAGYEKGRVTLDEYRSAVEKLVGAQQFAKDAAKAAADANAIFTRSADAAAQAIESSMQGLEDRATAAEAELAAYGKSKTAIEAETIARLENSLAVEKANDGSPETIANLEREIAARTRARDAFKNLEAADSAAKGAEAAAREWQKFADDIERSLTDSLYRAFESGQSFGEAFVNSLRNTLRTAALKVVVQAVTSPITNALQAAGGLSGAASGASALSNIGSLISAGGSMIGSGVIGEFGQGLAGTFVGPMQAGSAAAIGSSISAAMPYVAAAVIAYNLFATKSTPHIGGVAQYSAADGLGTNNQIRGANGNQGGTGFNLSDFDPGATAAASNLVKGIVTMFDGLAQRFGLPGGFSATAGFADDKSSDGAWGALRISTGGTDLVNWARGQRGGGLAFADGAAGQAEYNAAVAKSVRDALDAIDLPGWADDMLAALGDNASLADIAAVVDSINQTGAALDALRPTFEQIGIASEAAIIKIGKALGSLDAAGSAVAGYIAAIYSPADQTALAMDALRKTFDGLGLEMPATREAFRALVEAQIALGDAGADTLAVLLAIAPAFAQVTDAAADTAAAAANAAAQLARETQSWQDRLDVATGKRTQRDVALARDLASTDDPALQALIRKVYDAEALNDAARAWADTGNAAADAATSVRQAWQGVADGIAATMRQLRGEVAGTSGRGFAVAQSDFALATAAARAGDQSAAGRLPELARAVVELGRNVTGSATDQALLTARTIASLRTTLDGLKRFGIDVPAFAQGTNRVPADMLAQVHAGERIVPAADNAAIIDALQGGNVASEVRALRAEVAALREANSAENRAIAGHTYKTAQTLVSVIPDGDALATRAAT